MAAVGFTVKSGWAAFVLIERDGRGARVIDVRRVELCDPAMPASKQPYHDGFATMRPEGATLTSLLRSVRQYGGASVRHVLRQCQRKQTVAGVGLVVGSLIDPSTIGNEHIRIHALEGQLFRRVITEAVERCGMSCTVWRERDLPALPSGRTSDVFIHPPSATSGDAPWRKEQKQAALAAWMVLRQSAGA